MLFLKHDIDMTNIDRKVVINYDGKQLMTINTVTSLNVVDDHRYLLYLNKYEIIMNQFTIHASIMNSLIRSSMKLHTIINQLNFVNSNSGGCFVFTTA
jgi:hypothetical protein